MYWKKNDLADNEAKQYERKAAATITNNKRDPQTSTLGQDGTQALDLFFLRKQKGKQIHEAMFFKALNIRR